MTVSILLADDHHIVRMGLRALLEAEPGIEIVAEAADGLEAVRLTESLKPDVLVLDLMMPGLNGLEVTRKVSQVSAGTRVVILSVHANEAYVLEALRHGASGYLLKDTSTEELVYAIKKVAAGERYLSPPISERAIDAYLDKVLATAPQDPYYSLTDRERQVLHLAAEGLNNTEIAARLSISPRTVESHRANLMHKLGLRSQTDLIRFALRQGIIE